MATLWRTSRHLLLALGALVFACADGTDPEAKSNEAVSQVPQALSQAAAPRVALHRVAPAHLQAVQHSLQHRLSRSSAGLKITRAPDGSGKVSLDGRFQHVLISNKDSTGKSHIFCVDSHEGVAAALGHPVTPP